jgi:hypothetical protein
MPDAMLVKVVIPTRGLIFAQTIISLQENEVDGFIIINGFNIPDAQNEAVKQALTSKCTHIWFVEDDMAIPSGTLVAMLNLKKPVVCVDYPVISGWSTIAHAGDKVTRCGLGCTLIERSVFETIESPWFITNQSINAKDGSVVDIPYKYGGQDIWFSRKLKAAGLEIVQLEGVEASHLRCAQLSRIESNHGTYQISALPKVTQRIEE